MNFVPVLARRQRQRGGGREREMRGRGRKREREMRGRVRKRESESKFGGFGKRTPSDRMS